MRGLLVSVVVIMLSLVLESLLLTNLLFVVELRENDHDLVQVLAVQITLVGPLADDHLLTLVGFAVLFLAELLFRVYKELVEDFEQFVDLVLADSVLLNFTHIVVYFLRFFVGRIRGTTRERNEARKHFPTEEALRARPVIVFIHYVQDGLFVKRLTSRPLLLQFLVEFLFQRYL